MQIEVLTKPKFTRSPCNCNCSVADVLESILRLAQVSLGRALQDQTLASGSTGV